jgi:hypothetical protein
MTHAELTILALKKSASKGDQQPAFEMMLFTVGTSGSVLQPVKVTIFRKELGFRMQQQPEPIQLLFC